MALAFLLAAFALWWVWPRKPRSPQKQLATARRLLGVPQNASTATIEAAFRARIRTAHPDAGGTAQETHRLTAARDLLLATASQQRH